MPGLKTQDGIADLGFAWSAGPYVQLRGLRAGPQ